MRNLHKKLEAAMNKFGACPQGKAAFKRLIKQHPNATLAFIYKNLPVHHIYWFLGNFEDTEKYFQKRKNFRNEIRSIFPEGWDYNIWSGKRYRYKTDGYSGNVEKRLTKHQKQIIREIFNRHYPLNEVRMIAKNYLEKINA